MRAHRQAIFASRRQTDGLFASRIVRWVIAGGTVFAVAAFSPCAHASDPPATRSFEGLPGLYRVALPEPPATTLGVTASGGYGWFEPFHDRDGASHRGAGSLALGWTIAPPIDVGVRFEGWYDQHPSDAQGTDHVASGLPSARLRLRWPMLRDWKMAAELGAVMPGRTAPSVVPEAITPEVRLVSAWSFGPAMVSAQAGFRLDRTAKAVDDRLTVRSGDRISLGASDANAITTGLGGVVPLQGVAPFAELTSELFVGSSAPPVARSTWRMAAGVGAPIAASWSLGGAAEVLLSKRPLDDTVLLPTAPRWSVTAWLTWELGEARAPVPEVPRPKAEPVAPKPRPKPKPAPPVEALVAVTGDVTGENSQPIAGATVIVTAKESRFETNTDADGRFRLEGLPKASMDVEVLADGFESIRVEHQGGGPPLSVTLVTAVPRGELRGTVVGTAGQPLPATIRIEGSEKVVSTDESGQFHLEVAPGAYMVVVESDGCVPQRRQLRVENRGVTIFDVHLFKR